MFREIGMVDASNTVITLHASLDPPPERRDTSWRWAMCLIRPQRMNRLTEFSLL